MKDVVTIVTRCELEISIRGSCHGYEYNTVAPMWIEIATTNTAIACYRTSMIVNQLENLRITVLASIRVAKELASAYN